MFVRAWVVVRKHLYKAVEPQLRVLLQKVVRAYVAKQVAGVFARPLPKNLLNARRVATKFAVVAQKARPRQRGTRFRQKRLVAPM